MAKMIRHNKTLGSKLFGTAAMALSMLLVTGCTANQETPGPSNTVTPSPTVAPTPSESPSTIGAEALAIWSKIAAKSCAEVEASGVEQLDPNTGDRTLVFGSKDVYQGFNEFRGLGTGEISLVMEYSLSDTLACADYYAFEMAKEGGLSSPESIRSVEVDATETTVKVSYQTGSEVASVLYRVTEGLLVGAILVDQEDNEFQMLQLRYGLNQTDVAELKTAVDLWKASNG